MIKVDYPIYALLFLNSIKWLNHLLMYEERLLVQVSLICESGRSDNIFKQKDSKNKNEPTKKRRIQEKREES